MSHDSSYELSDSNISVTQVHSPRSSTLSAIRQFAAACNYALNNSSCYIILN